MARSNTVKRETKETKISISIDLDGTGKAKVNTGIGFLDHMFNTFAKHGFFDIEVEAVGDLNVDTHHLTEDLGIVLGLAIKGALGDKKGIRRFGDCILPMDETLMLAAIDLSGRPYFSFDCDFETERVGELETQCVREFFYALSYSAEMNLHIRKISGSNDHHKIEAMFKALARALDEAVSLDPRSKSVPSTKGTL